MAEIFHLDLTGSPYPQPVMRTQALLEEGRRGPLTIAVDEAVSAAAVSALLAGAGLKTQTYRQDERWLVLGRESGDSEILVWFGPDGWRAALEERIAERSEGEPILELGPSLAPRTPSGAPAEPRPAEERAVALFGSQFMGRGEDGLGGRLATAFFDALAALDPPPRLLAFYNTGVFLTTRDSAIVEALRDLAGRGAVVITSGLCLAHFNLENQLKVGRIGNMYEIVKAQTQAAKVIRF